MAKAGGENTMGMNGGDGVRRLWDSLRRSARPAAYFSQNWISRIGVVVTTTSAITLIIAYASQILGYTFNPYLGILVLMILPGFFVLGLLLIPIGIYRQFRKQRRLGTLPSQYPLVSFSGRSFVARRCLWRP